MLMPLLNLNWMANALSMSPGLPMPHLAARKSDIISELRRVVLSPASTSQSLAHILTPTPSSNWSQAPTTRAQVFAERLADVRPVCVRGSRDDARNCLLDLPPDTNVEVSASRLMLAGCEASLPAPVRTVLTRQRRDSDALEKAFSETFAAESEGKYSVASIEARLTQQLSRMSPDTQRMLRHADTYIEIPQLGFLRVVSSEQEARRHHVEGPFPERRVRRSVGAPEVRDAMLGAYIRTPVGGKLHSLFVSLATPSTVQQVIEDTLTHAGQHVTQLFGEVPEAYMTSRMQMRTVGPGKNIVRTLAELLHEGHQRFGEFARGETREALAPESHGHIRQRRCQPGTHVPSATTTQTPAPTQTTSRIDAQPQTSALPVQEPSRARMRREGKPSLAEMQAAIAELERQIRKMSSQSRPRYG